MINQTPALLFLASFFLLSSTALAEEQGIKELNQALAYIKESYYGTVDMSSLAGLSLQAVVDSLDKDSRLVEGGMPSLDFVRGLEGEASIAKVGLIAPEMGYIKINFFGRRTGFHFHEALEVLGYRTGTRIGHKEGIKGLLLDLRDNPGGHLQSALEVLKHFVPPGKTLLVEKTRGGEKPYLLDVGSATEIPLIILINGSTASSAEIVAAALRDHSGARVVGERSKGKGTIQEVIPLGTRTLILTVGEYLLPDGSSLRDKGVIPDMEVKGHEEQLQAALSLISGVH
ncbi:MAG: S41 family peptidase [Candidatus Brocadiales bacterium]